MSSLFLRRSLALWRRRHAYRQRRLDAAHQRDDVNAITKWQRLLEDAGEMIRRRQRQLAAKQHTNLVWMPAVRKSIVETAGPFLTGKPKGVLHTTEGKDFAAMDRTLRGKAAEPHFLVGSKAGQILQYMPLDRASRALEHVGPPETNRAHAIQIEVCWDAAEPNWPAQLVTNVRKVMRFVEANAGVQRVSTVKFTNSRGVRRLSPQAWLINNGWVGHQHVPNQPSGHWDPGAIDVEELL